VTIDEWAHRGSSIVDDVRRVLADTAADQRTAITATLIRATGDWDLAEDCVQDAVERALARWPVDGLPDNPAGWLTTTARNRALDVLRRRRTERAKLQEVAVMAGLDRSADQAEQPVDDDRLRLLFTCCHPALALESRVALTLRMAGGLSTRAIAQAFLISESTASQRLLRAKRKIGNAGIAFRVPAENRLAERTGGVLAVLYLIFNEGYGAPDVALAGEALRLTRLLVELLPDHDEARGLLALMLFQHARRATRFDADGDLVPMEEQDRRSWDAAAIDEGRWQLRRAASSALPAGPFRLQAAIAGCHASASSADTTDWATIVAHYDALHGVHPSPVIALNRAIAIGMRDGLEAGLAVLERAAAAPELASYYLVPAAQADFQRRLGRNTAAAAAYRAALELAPTDPDRRFIRRRLREVGG
jgi:RNA polymerase sigma-70 factor (ECF subfamily)